MPDTPERLWVDLRANGYGPKSVPDDVKPHGVVCIVDTPENLALSPDVQAMIREAEARVAKIAAGLFPGGYDASLAKIDAALEEAPK